MEGLRDFTRLPQLPLDILSSRSHLISATRGTSPDEKPSINQRPMAAMQLLMFASVPMDSTDTVKGFAYTISTLTQSRSRLESK
jgi:hypothetical protein